MWTRIGSVNQTCCAVHFAMCNFVMKPIMCVVSQCQKQGGNFTAARTLVLMLRKKKKHLTATALCPSPFPSSMQKAPVQHGGLALNYSHPSAQQSLFQRRTSVSSQFTQVESHHHIDQTAAASQSRRTTLTAQVNKRAKSFLIWNVTDLCNRI